MRHGRDMANSNSIRAGVVGTGSIGRNHARVLSEFTDASFAAICDTDPAVAGEMAARFGAKAVASLEEFAALVDAATIATPTPSHFKIAKFLLERGKHVLVEKPITETTADAVALSRLAHERGLVLQVGHIERFNPALAALEARLTQPRFIEVSRLSPYPGRSLEIGVVLDLMIHDLEIILHLVKSPVQSVDAVGVPVLSRGEDIANVRLRFANGCVANITASRISQERLRKIRVFQKDAYLSLDYQKQEGYLLRLGGRGRKGKFVSRQNSRRRHRRNDRHRICRAQDRPRTCRDRKRRAIEARTRRVPRMRPRWRATEGHGPRRDGRLGARARNHAADRRAQPHAPRMNST